nr:hypothetical protein [Candidatus Sigynarchaeota archaeon]
MTKIGMAIDQINVFDVNGNTVFFRLYREDTQVDQTLMSAFFSAVRQFAAHVMEGEIQGIKIGAVMLNFKLLALENDNLVFLVISNGFSESSASEITENLAEHFAIQLDNFIQEKGVTFTQFKDDINMYRDEFDAYFSPACDGLIQQTTAVDSVSLDLPVKVPNTLLKKIYDILLKNPALNDVYENGAIDIIVEALQNYIFSDRFLKDLKDKYK